MPLTKGKHLIIATAVSVTEEESKKPICLKGRHMGRTYGTKRGTTQENHTGQGGYRVKAFNQGANPGADSKKIPAVDVGVKITTPKNWTG